MADVPKALILFPVNGELVGMVRGDTNLFEHLRGAYDLMCEVVRKTSTPQKRVWGDGYYVIPACTELTYELTICDFIDLHKEFEEKDGKGVKNAIDLEDLLYVRASDVLTGQSDPVALLDPERDASNRPVIINFREWWENLRAGGYFTGTIEEFWTLVQSSEHRTEMDSLRITTGISIFDVKLGVPWTLVNPEKNIGFYFHAYTKHCDDEVLRTDTMNIKEFVGVVEDVLKSIT